MLCRKDIISYSPSLLWRADYLITRLLTSCFLSGLYLVSGDMMLINVQGQYVGSWVIGSGAGHVPGHHHQQQIVVQQQLPIDPVGNPAASFCPELF